MQKLNITFKNDENTPRFPIHCQYGGQYSPQPAYIFLDLRNGECGADYNGEIGSTPVLQWHGIILTFEINAGLTADTIEQLIEDSKADFQAILDGSSVDWDGNNNVGVLNESARSIYNQINESEIFNNFQSEIISDLVEYLQDEVFPSAGQSIEDFVEEVYERNGDNGYFFADSLDSEDEILASLRFIWADDLYSGNDISSDIARHLIKHGTCDESAWLEELNEFANA